MLVVAVDPAFRELLLFTAATPKGGRDRAATPVRRTRRTCNRPGAEAGWRVLKPGEMFAADVEYRLLQTTGANDS